MQKPLLSDFLREEVRRQYGSIRAFADSAEIDYERLRKLFQRNRFSKDDLDRFIKMLGLTSIDLSPFEHSIGRKKNPRLRDRIPLLSKTITGIVSEEHVSLVIENPVILQRIRCVVADELHRIVGVIGQVRE